jgi:hypothetical protein
VAKNTDAQFGQVTFWPAKPAGTEHGLEQLGQVYCRLSFGSDMPQLVCLITGCTDVASLAAPAQPHFCRRGFIGFVLGETLTPDRREHRASSLARRLVCFAGIVGMDDGVAVWGTEGFLTLGDGVPSPLRVKGKKYRGNEGLLVLGQRENYRAMGVD